MENEVKSEKLENQTPEILEGEYNTPIQKERYFRSLSALTDFVKVFEITSGSFQELKTNGSRIYLLRFNNKSL